MTKRLTELYRRAELERDRKPVPKLQSEEHLFPAGIQINKK